MGEDRFYKMMSDYFAENAGKTVGAASFLEKAGSRLEFPDPGDGPAYLTTDIGRRLGTAVIVYGTDREAGANRYAAEKLQSDFNNQYESRVPIYKDFEVNDDLLRGRDVVFVGRPETNSALSAWADKLGLKYEGAVFTLGSDVYSSERQGLLFAAKNPLDPSHMALVVAGNDALRTVKAIQAQDSAAYNVYEEARDQAAQQLALEVGHHRHGEPVAEQVIRVVVSGRKRIVVGHAHQPRRLSRREQSRAHAAAVPRPAPSAGSTRPPASAGSPRCRRTGPPRAAVPRASGDTPSRPTPAFATPPCAGSGRT